MLYFTSSLVNSRPEWNCTPLRRFTLICLASLLTSQLSASMGCGFNCTSYCVNRSNANQTLWDDGCRKCGSSVTMSPTWPDLMVPPALGAPAAGFAAALALAAGEPAAGEVAGAAALAGALV